MTTFVLIRGGEVHAPEPLGPATVLAWGESIVRVGAVDERALAAAGLDCEVIDAAGALVVPGLIDPHQHIIGGGGESGFVSRTPEVTIDEIVAAGITTVVGLLGTDTTTRHLTSLLAKARQLDEQGVTAYMYTGGFPVPPPTITGSVTDDLVIVDKVIGLGEIAISDVRSTEPTTPELARLVSQAYVGGTLSGKAGVTHFHVGPGKGLLAPLHALLDEHELPAECVYPTHITRSGALMDDAIRLSQRGSFVDIDTIDEDFAVWLRYYWDNGGVPGRLTVSSDAHTAGGRIGRVHEALVAGVREARLPLDDVLPLFTRNPADVLKLHRKGRLREGSDADIVVLGRDSLDVRHVVARGRVVVRDGAVVEGLDSASQVGG